MAANPSLRQTAAPAYHLEPFQRSYANLVISWVRDEREAFWLAPRTPPPLTAADVLCWQLSGHQPFLMRAPETAEPLAYGELNVLNAPARRYWLGHLIVDPARRGRGHGLRVTQLLLRRAFVHNRAREVSLVVFPDNHAAIACYRAAGMREDGYETHDFPAYAAHVDLLRMVATSATYSAERFS